MKISDYLSTERTGFLNAATKREALNELIDMAAQSPLVKNRHELTEAVWKREELMSTGIGMGIAVPHVRLKSVEDMVMALGIHREGLSDYGSIDGKPVYTLVLIAAPEGKHAQYIRMLAQVVEALKDETMRTQLLAAETPEEAFGLFTAGD